ncbi:uncharacterized protein ACNS7B_013316 isoform 2-T2 [Menidia menidia]
MAWHLLGLLVALTGTLLLVSGRGWERINEKQLLRFYETGQWSDPLNETTDEVFDYDDYKDEIPAPTERVSTTDKSEDALEEAEDGYVDYDDYSYEDGFPDEAEDDHAYYYIYGDGIPDGDEMGMNDTYPEEAFLEVEGVVTNGTYDPFNDETSELDSALNNQPNGAEPAFRMEFVDAPSRSWTVCTSSSYGGLHVVCSEDGFQISLLSGLSQEIQVVGLTNVSLKNAPKKCGYRMNHLDNTMTVPFTGCNVREHVEDLYSLHLSITISSRTQELVAFCVESTKFNLGLFPRAFSKRSKCNELANSLLPTAEPTRCSPQPAGSVKTVKSAAAEPAKCLQRTTAPPSKPPTAHNCAVNVAEQVSCGDSKVSASDCEKRGCCMDLSKHACYYPLDECTADGHFVFAIRHNSASIPVDPKQLAIPSRPQCKPVIVNDEVAIFKIDRSSCGALSYDIGDSKIYLIEVHTIAKALNLKYGIITRSDPLRFLVECHYSKNGIPQDSAASVSYMVKTSASSLPSSITSSDSYGIELKIAKDHTYSSYFPSYHQPLRLLLGQPVYLELSLKSDKPDAVILVNYCLAYPRSAKSAVVLIYEGCANPNDPNVSILNVIDHPNSRHRKRFIVNAFQFMDQKTNLYLNEEIYFMCSAEVCFPSEKTCKEQCFDGTAI